MNFLGSTLNGVLMEKGLSTRILMIAGNVINVLSFSFLGPIPIGEGVHPVFWMALFGLVLNGLAAAVMYTAGFADPVQVAKVHGFPSDETTNGLIASATMVAVTMGAFLGPLAGGYLLQHFGMHWGVLVIVGTNAVSMLFMFLLIFLDKRQKVTLPKPLADEEDSLLKKPEARRRRLTTSMSMSRPYTQQYL